jgi:diacylglycerol O-acyltransferase / wax synthase
MSWTSLEGAGGEIRQSIETRLSLWRIGGCRPARRRGCTSGPQAQPYFLGCEVDAMYPLDPLFHGCGLNVTAMSLNGTPNVGVISCPDLLPDLWRLVDEFDVALQELLECTGPAHV